MTSRIFIMAGLVVGSLANAAPSQEVDYRRDIKPVLKAKCYSCHGALQQEADLRIDTADFMRQGGDSGPVLDSDLWSDSLIWQRITSDDASLRMPPEGEPLSPEQLGRFRTWLLQGAEAPADEKAQPDPATHWGFQPLDINAAESALSKIDQHPIDHFIDSKLTAKNLSRAPQAEAVTLIRRMFLDLHGLPPTPQDLEIWTPRLSEGNSEVAVKELIDTLLASPRYGERWAQHWLDIVRYADTHGFEVNTPRPNAWPYRDYVIQAFNNDTPYDRFIKEQLAGDVEEAPTATGFLVAAAALLPGQIGQDDASKRLARADELDEIIVGTSATFLGLTVGCARCHDHKFDPISQQDYYAFQAFFSGVNYGDREIRDHAFLARIAEADKLKPQLSKLRAQLAEYQPVASTKQTIIIDDEDLERVSILAKKNGHGTNPAGTHRGYRDDPGDARRCGNLSRGRYTWWPNNPGQDVFTWNPTTAGQFRVWVSWGVHGSGVHTNDARYVLDRDGDLSTTFDQQTIATADQHRFAGVTDGETEQKPLWSGLLNAGVHEFTDQSKVVLRCGETKTGITADVIVLQEEGNANPSPTPELPHLRKPIGFAQNIEWIPPTKTQYVRFTSLATVDNNRHEPCLDELKVFSTDAARGNVALAENRTVATSSGDYSTSGRHQLKHINDGRYGNDFSWISNQRGKGWVQLKFADVETIQRLEWGRDRTGKFQDRLSTNYRIETSLDGINWNVVASSSDREPIGTPHDPAIALLRHQPQSRSTQLKELTNEIAKLEQRDQQLRTPRRVFAGVFKDPGKTYLLNRGDPEQPVHKVNPQILTHLSDVSLPDRSGDIERRTELGGWIASVQNPLTARVMVNRIWQYHFGVGVVETSSDFGLNGARPSHPELLDWLAREFIRNSWSVKNLHRMIMTSETYQQASAAKSDASASGKLIDGDNRLLWHFPSRRLEAEAIRDCILHVSGKLNLKTGGPGFDFFTKRGGLSGFPPVEEFGEEQFRRMIYAHKVRMEPVPIFGAFDCPDAGLPTPRRSQSTTAIQALSLFNSRFVIDQAAEFAERIQQEVASQASQKTENAVGQPSADVVRRAFLLSLGRLPNDRELTAAAKAVEDHGLPTLCRALFNSNEFLFLP